MKLLKIIVLFILSTYLVAGQQLTDPGATPDSILYGLDRASEAIRLALTINNAKEAELHLKYAEERLAELKEMIEENKLKHVEKLMERREKHIGEAQKEVDKESSKGKDVSELLSKVEEATSKHIAVLTELLGKVPDQAKDSIQHAIEVSSKGTERAVEAIAKREEEKPAGQIPAQKPEEPGKPEDVETKMPEPESKETEKVGEQGKGRLNMQITDKPNELNITSLKVTISLIQVHAAGNVIVSETVCGNETITEEICENETVSETNEVCVNETTVQEICINQTINETGNETNEAVVEVCNNETITEEVCNDEIINTTEEVCAIETDVIENCIDQSSNEANWITVMEGPAMFDLIEIKDVKEFLGSKELGVGKYTQIRLSVNNSRLYVDGEEMPLKIPSEKIKLIKNFNINENETTTLTLDFDAQESVHKTSIGSYNMRPTIKVIQES